MTVDILGTEYTIEYRTEIEDSALIGINGYINRTSKRIVVDIVKQLLKRIEI